jgi:hypothetical protein
MRGIANRAFAGVRVCLVCVDLGLLGGNTCPFNATHARRPNVPGHNQP